MLDKSRLSISAVAKRLDVSVATVWRWVNAGLSDGRRLKTLKIGGRRYVFVDDLEAFISAGNEQSIAEYAGVVASRRAEAAGKELDAIGI